MLLAAAMSLDADGVSFDAFGNAMDAETAARIDHNALAAALGAATPGPSSSALSPTTSAEHRGLQ